LLSPARFKIVCCGRQWGKTVLGSILCIEEAIRGGDVWWVAPSFPIGELAWAIIEKLCVQIPGTKFEHRPIYRITLPTGGTIQLRSADNPDSLRGATLSGAVMDEAAMAKSDAWTVLRPTLLRRRGWAVFISTPKGLNWYYDLFLEAERRKNWERWQFPSASNPFLSEEEIEQDRLEMHPLIFAQEYEAEFVQASGTMFKREWMVYYTAHGGEYVLGNPAVSPDVQRVPMSRCTRFATVDLAFSVEERADYTVIASWAVTPSNQLLLLDVIRGQLEAPSIIPAMQMAFTKHGLGYLAVERTTRQLGIIKDADRAGLPIKEVRADRNKLSRAMPAAARMERGQISFPAGTPWMRDLEEEMLAFPAGRHDDFVDCLGYACAEIARGKGRAAGF
jgi:predicted phage terminase large subunit-like protein